MDTKAQIQADLKEAMRTGDTATRDTLRLLGAAIKQVEVDGQAVLDDTAVQAILMKQAKQRRESITEYTKAGREDLVGKEQEELAIIERYLPKMLGREEIIALATPIIAALGATDAKSMGAVMGQLMPQVKGKADGQLVNQVVRELLA
jgi:uncharacterized protein